MAKQKKASETVQHWGRNYYIKGFGRVNYGDIITKEAMDCWKAISESKPITL